MENCGTFFESGVNKDHNKGNPVLQSTYRKPALANDYTDDDARNEERTDKDADAKKNHTEKDREHGLNVGDELPDPADRHFDVTTKMDGAHS